MGPDVRPCGPTATSTATSPPAGRRWSGRWSCSAARPSWPRTSSPPGWAAAGRAGGTRHGARRPRRGRRTGRSSTAWAERRRGTWWAGLRPAPSPSGRPRTCRDAGPADPGGPRRPGAAPVRRPRRGAGRRRRRAGGRRSRCPTRPTRRRCGPRARACPSTRLRTDARPEAGAARRGGGDAGADRRRRRRARGRWCSAAGTWWADRRRRPGRRRRSASTRSTPSGRATRPRWRGTPRTSCTSRTRRTSCRRSGTWRSSAPARSTATTRGGSSTWPTTGPGPCSATKDPVAPFAASDALGWVAWVDPAGARPAAARLRRRPGRDHRRAGPAGQQVRTPGGAGHAAGRHRPARPSTS